MPVPTPNKGETQQKGYKTTSDQHCAELKCPKCGGQMRRTERPGPGKEEIETTENFIKIKVVEFKHPEKGVLEKVTEYSFDKNLYSEEEAKKWMQKRR